MLSLFAASWSARAALNESREFTTSCFSCFSAFGAASSVEAIAAAQEPVQNAIEADTSSSEEPKLSSEDSSSDKGLAGFDFVS